MPRRKINRHAAPTPHPSLLEEIAYEWAPVRHEPAHTTSVFRRSSAMAGQMGLSVVRREHEKTPSDEVGCTVKTLDYRGVRAPEYAHHDGPRTTTRKR